MNQFGAPLRRNYSTRRGGADKKDEKKRRKEQQSEHEKTKSRLNLFFLAILGLGGVQFIFVIYQYFTPPYSFLSVENKEQLEKVFFSGQPWLILCNDGSRPVHSVFTEVAQAARSSHEFHTGVLDCNAKLPKGKSTLEKHKIKPASKKDSHQAILCVNGKCKPVPQNYLYKSAVKEGLLAYTRDKIKLQYGIIKNDKSFETCMKSKKGSVIVAVNDTLSEYGKGQLASIMTSHRRLRFCTMNVVDYRLAVKKRNTQEEGEKNKPKTTYLTFDKKNAPLKRGEGRLVVFKRVKIITEEGNEEDDKSASVSNILAYKEISIMGEPPDPHRYLSQLKNMNSTINGSDLSQYKMVLIDENVSVVSRKKRRKAQKNKARRSGISSSEKEESGKERRARIKRERDQKRKTQNKKTNGNSPSPPNMKETEAMQRERELARRDQMEREAAQNFAQAAEEEDAENDDTDEEAEVIDPDEEEGIMIDLDDEEIDEE